MYWFLLSHPRKQRFFAVRPQRFQPSAFLKFDVAKLGATGRKCKKTTSTKGDAKALINKAFKKRTLYNEKTAGGAQKEIQKRNIYKIKRKSLIMKRGV